MTPILTKDGVTVAKAINIREKFPNLGVQLVKEAAARTADCAGDGTTTATVLAQAIFSEGLKLLVAGVSPADLKEGIDAATQEVVKNLRAMALTVESDDIITQVGTISANGELEVGELITEALRRVGRDGVITVEEAKGSKTTLEVVDGMQIDRGYLSPYFITNDERMSVELEDPLVLITNKKVSSLKEILPFLEQVLEAGRSLLIVADEVDGEALQALVVNKLKSVLSVCAIKAPGFGDRRWDLLGDLVAVTGGSIVSDATGISLEKLTLADVGSCSKVIVTRHAATFVGGSGLRDSIDDRVRSIRERSDDPTLDDAERSYLKDRLAKLVGGVAVIRVGGATEVELKERKDRVDDALHATQAALVEGVVPGGGVALVRASQSLRKMKLAGDRSHGVTTILLACEAPLRQIVTNAGRSADVALQKVLKVKSPTQGYDARDGKYKDMLEAGIVDPVKVVRSALENSSSVASMMLTVGCVMVDDDDPRSP
jgi:chaperonin GroEL